MWLKARGDLMRCPKFRRAKPAIFAKKMEEELVKWINEKRFTSTKKRGVS